MGRKRIYENANERLRIWRAKKALEKEKELDRLLETYPEYKHNPDPVEEVIEVGLIENNNDTRWYCPNCNRANSYNWLNCFACHTDMPKELEEKAMQYVKDHPREIIKVVRF